jgi:hypothetical protein
VLASARSPPRCFPRLFPERSLLAIPSAAVAEEVFPCLGRSASSSFRFSPVPKQIQKVSGLRREPTLKVWQTFRLFAGFRCIFPFAQIHFHAFLQMRLQHYTQGYPARYTQGWAASVESSGQQTSQQTSMRTYLIVSSQLTVSAVVLLTIVGPSVSPPCP